MKSIIRFALLSVVPLLGSTLLHAQVPQVGTLPTPGSVAAVGIGTATPSAFFNVAVGKDALFGLDVSGAGNKLIWYGSKGAFRAGIVDGTQWNTGTVGIGSMASGMNTIASGSYSTALGYNTQTAGIAAFATGENATANGSSATAMGSRAVANGAYSIAMGTDAEANGSGSTAIGTEVLTYGTNSIALGTNSVADGGSCLALGTSLIASGLNSTAMGYNVSTNGKTGSVIIGDGQSDRYVSDGNFKMTMRFAGGYVLYSGVGPQNLGQATIPPGVELRSGQNAWFVISDSTKKENYRPVDGAAFLKKIGQMRLGSWNYRGQDAKTFRHYGPMAQDFFAAFGHDALGTIGEPTGINQGDFDGVNLIAIKALITEVNQLKADNEQLRRQLDETQQLRTDLDSARQQDKRTQARLAKIEALLSDPAGRGTASLKP